MKYLLGVLVVLCAGLGSAQNLLVLDAELASPLERVTVVDLDNPSLRTLTNDQGRTDIASFRRSERIQISSLGFASRLFTYQDLAALNFTVLLGAEPLALDQVVVSATRWSQSSRELPMAISSLKPRNVFLEGPPNTADLLGNSGEVFVQKSQQGGGSPMMRGFATNRLLIAVDGVRMNNAIFRSGNLQQVISLDPFALERTEIFFGPGSVIYGSDAIGGVMSFQTLRAQFSQDTGLEVSGRVNGRMASANRESSGHLDLNLANQRWASRTSISHFRYGDLLMGRYGPEDYLRSFYVQNVDGSDRSFTNHNPRLQVPTAYQQSNVMQKLAFRPNRNWEFGLALHHSASSRYDRYDRLIRTRDGLPRSAEWFYGPQIWQMQQLNVEHRQGRALYDQAVLRLARQYFEESRNDRDFGDDWRTEREEKVEAWSLNLDLNKRLNVRHKLFYGLEAVHNEVQSEGQARNLSNGQLVNASDRYPQAHWSSFAAYLNHEWEWNEKTTSQVGMRYNQVLIDADFRNNLDFFPLPFASSRLSTDALTGSAGVVYRPSERWKLRFNLATAFRAPNVDDIGKVFDSGDRVVVVPNPDLKPEYAYHGEGGIAFRLHSALKLELSVYYTHLAQAMVRRPFRLGGQDSLLYDGELSQVQAVQNAAQARVYGLQLGLDWQHFRGFFFRGRFNWQEGEEEDGAGRVGPSRHAAPLFGLACLGFRSSGVELQTRLRFSGAVPFSRLNFEERDKPWLYASNRAGEPYSPAWYAWDLRILVPLGGNLQISGGVENLSDQRYRPYSSGLTAAGRNFTLGIEKRF